MCIAILFAQQIINVNMTLHSQKTTETTGVSRSVSTWSYNNSSLLRYTNLLRWLRCTATIIFYYGNSLSGLFAAQHTMYSSPSTTQAKHPVVQLSSITIFILGVVLTSGYTPDFVSK